MRRAACGRVVMKEVFPRSPRPFFLFGREGEMEGGSIPFYSLFSARSLLWARRSSPSFFRHEISFHIRERENTLSSIEYHHNCSSLW